MECCLEFFSSENLLLSNKLKSIFLTYPLHEFNIIPFFCCSLNSKHLHILLERNNNNLEVFAKNYSGKFIKIIPIFISNEKIKYYKDLWISHMMNNNLDNIESILEHALGTNQIISDIHFTPTNNEVVINYRISGKIKTIESLNIEKYNNLIYQLKNKASLDIFKKKSAQSGAVRFFYEGKRIFTRVSFHPSVMGEKIAIRILNNIDINTLEELSVSKEDANSLRKMTNNPGLFIAAGATGSGKTTTVYTILKELLKEKSLNIITVEDPIEYYIDGICQTNVADMSYAESLKSALRQDLDVLFIGEIRDEETVKYAVRAAMTGHLVVTTMHLTSVNQALLRLQDLGIAPSFLQQHLAGVFLQRLEFKEDNNKSYIYPIFEFWNPNLKSIESSVNNILINACNN